MPRGRRGFSRSNRSHRYQATAARPISQRQHQRMYSGLGQSLFYGLAFGLGAGLTHQAVKGAIGSKDESRQEQACLQEQQQFTKCIQDNNEISICQQQMDLFKECAKKYAK